MDASLYTFKREDNGQLVKIVRLTDSAPDDWYVWGERFAQQHPEIGLPLDEVCAIEVVDEREVRA